METEEKRVRVIFRNKVYLAGRPYVIPIVKTNDGWQTGQNLTEEKMFNPDKCTAEDRERYPFIIDPRNHYKVSQGQWLALNTPYNKAIYDLLVLSKQWAIGESAYGKDKSQYVGYLEDKEVEAKSKNTFRDERWEAESLVRNSPLSDYRKIALMLNIQIKSFNANIDFMKEDELKDKILGACEESPELVKKCFPKFNEGVEFDYFVLECIHYGVLNQKPNGDIFDATEFIGSSLVDVRKALSKKDNEYKKTKWGKALNDKKGLTTILKTTDKAEQEDSMVKAVKVALFENDLEETQRTFDTLRRYYPNSEAIVGLNNHIGVLQGSNQPDKDTSQEKGKTEEEDVNQFSDDVYKFRFGLQNSTIEKLRSTISHQKSKYKEEDAKPIWDDFGALVEYMVK